MSDNTLFAIMLIIAWVYWGAEDLIEAYFKHKHRKGKDEKDTGNGAE